MLHVTVQPTACQIHTVRVAATPILSKGERCRHAAGAEQTMMPQHTCSERYIIHITVAMWRAQVCLLLATNMSQLRNQSGTPALPRHSFSLGGQ